MAETGSLLALPAPPAAIVPFTASNTVGEPVEQKLARLRSEREAHKRNQVWTKDAHDGPYRKAKMGKDFDPLLQLPDGTDRQVDLGYERVKTGPTSNFVGNHMTQGAIDLVQAQLERPTVPSLPALEASGDQMPQLLLDAPKVDTVSAKPLPRPIHCYSWTDAGSVIQLEVPMSQMELGGGGSSAQLKCSFRRDSLELEVVLREQGKLGVGKTGSTHEHKTEGVTSGNVAYRLLVRPLHAAVLPLHCFCFVSGVPALPACSGQETSGFSGLAELQRGCSSSIGGEESRVEQQGQAEEHCVGFTLPPSAEAVVIQLAKADEQLHWGELQASMPLVPRQAASNQAHLSALRREVRQKLGRCPAPQAVAVNNSTPKQAPSLENEGIATWDPAAWQAAVRDAEVLMAAGRYAEVLDASAACLRALPAATCETPTLLADMVQLHALRGRSYWQLGGFKQAFADYSAAIQLAQQEAYVGGNAGLSELLLARASLYEQLERPLEALTDVQEAARLQPAAPAVLLLAQRLRSACRQAAA